jgi:iron(III) transport system substrate-binding protein
MNKKILLIFIAFSLLLASCASNTVTLQEKDMAAWLKTAKLSAKETPTQLYKAALKEDTLVVYSISTRITDVKKSFEAQYPGLTVEVQDIRADDLIAALHENYKERQYNCDISICTDSDTLLSRDLIPNGILYKYVPPDIADKILPIHNTDQLEFLGEIIQLFYNDEVYTKSPVTNWWQLTEPRFKGKVYIADPVRSHTTFAALCSIVQNSNEMAKAYRELYGKDLAIPEGSNAGKVFLQRLLENDLKLVNSSDEVVVAVGTPGQAAPPVGILISSKARMHDIGYALAPVFDAKPRVGAYVLTSAMIVGGAKNINTAKLFIRWLLGETYGKGEGSKPYLQTGAWGVRKDVQSRSPVSLNQLNFWRLDKDYLSKNQKDIMSFWLSLQ